MSETGMKVRYRRKLLHISQEDLAQKLGYKGRQSINNIEMGKADIPLDKLVDFANALQVSPQYFLSSGNGLTDVICDRYWNVKFSEEEIQRILQFIDFTIQSRS